MKIFFALVAVLLVSLIDAAPKPTRSPRQLAQSLKKADKTPSTATGTHKGTDKRKRQIPFLVPAPYYAPPAAPVADFQHALQAAFLSGIHFAELEKSLKNNLTDASGKALPAFDAKALAAFEAGFEAHSFDVKPLKLDSVAPVPVVKPEKLGNVNGSVVGLTPNALFAPELAPRFELHFTPGQGLTLDALPPFAGGIHAVAPVGPAFEPVPYGAEVGPYAGFGIAPGLVSPYPYPYPFLPGVDPKGLKPIGNGGAEKKPEKMEGPTEATPSNPEGPQGPPAEGAPSDSPSGPASESPSSEAPSQ